MAGFLPDTSCMVAAICAWHEHHAPAFAEIERRLERGEQLVVAAPALVEAYAVLTRLPPPHRLSPDDAGALLELNFIRPARLVTLRAREYTALLRSTRRTGVAGGRTYDAVIAACASAGQAEVFLTFNARHFVRLFDEAIEVVVPAEDRPE